MKKKLVINQCNNYTTYIQKRDDCISLASNVFKIDNYRKNCPNIDMSFIQNQLLTVGSIAWFEDEVLGILALPYTVVGKLDVYNRPRKIRVTGENGYTRLLKSDNFVIMYDNMTRMSIFSTVLQYAERLANLRRVMDINTDQQKTPRFWSVPKDMEQSLIDAINEADGNCETIVGYNNINLEECNVILSPAPFLLDKLQDAYDRLYNEFLDYIGIANLTIQKKERLIRDEVIANQGGTIAHRLNRFEARKYAIEQINERWGLDLEVKYYDGVPNSAENTIEEGEEDVL